jgi:hypothetical protein
MSGSRMAGIMLYTVWVTAGCSCGLGAAQQSPQPAVEVAPPTPIAEQKDELGKPSWDPQWDLIVEEALPPELLSPEVARDVRAFCPRFKVMSDVDKRTYWAYFFQALAGAEAGLVPTTNVRHAEMDAKDSITKRNIRSEGLLQLTYMDADRYGCDFDWDNDKELAAKDPAKTILQPRNNLLCGIKILEKQLIDRREPLLSRKSYWATLQPGTVSYSVFRKQMTNVPAVCRVAIIPEEAKKKTLNGTVDQAPGIKTIAAEVR